MTQNTVKIKNKIPKVITALSSTQQKSLLKSIGSRFERELSEGITRGDSSWAALSSEWIEEKGHARPWYYTGRTQGAIKYKLDGSKVYSGWVDGGEVAEIAEYLEYGTSRIPARPLLRPVFEENKNDVVKEAVKWVKDAVKKGKI